MLLDLLGLTAAVEVQTTIEPLGIASAAAVGTPALSGLLSVPDEDQVRGTPWFAITGTPMEAVWGQPWTSIREGGR